jgi:spore maturation protein CgeB
MGINSIFLFGRFSAGCLEASYQRAFESIGVNTHTFDVDEHWHRLNWIMRNRVAHRLTIKSHFVRNCATWKFNISLEEAVLASKSAVVLIFKGEFVMPETLRRLRYKGVRIVVFHPDNPFPPHPSQRPETLPTAFESDLYLIWSERLVEELKNAGVKNPSFLPFAWDSEVFPYQNNQVQGAWPGVLFLGGWDKEREEFLEGVASYIPLRIFGPDYWGSRTLRSSRVRRCWQGSALHMTEAAKVIRESAVCLNILRSQHYINGIPDGLIMRHFEVPGSGGFLLSTRGGGATSLFRERETGEFFSDLKECVEKAKNYIANTSARLKLVNQAHDLIASQHQYTNRAREILHLLDSC